MLAMNLLLFMLLWLEPMVLDPMAASISLATFAQDKSLLESIGNAVNEAMKAVSGKRPLPRTVSPPPMPGVQRIVGADPTEEDKARLRAYSKAMCAWIEKSCELSDEQRSKLQELTEKSLNNESRWRDIVGITSNELRGVQAFGPCFPILFTMKTSGVATKFQRQILDSISTTLLTPDQQQRLTATLDERTRFGSAAFREYIISLADNELFLTNEQRVKLSTELGGNRVIHHGLYSFQPQPYYLPYESMRLIIGTWNSIFSKPQQQRLEDLVDSANERNVTFQSSVGLDGWYKQIDEYGAKQRNSFLRAVAVRVAYYELAMGITTEQANLLTVAGKGAAVSAVFNWKETTRATVERMEQQMLRIQGNFAFSSQRMSMEGLDANEIWSQTLKSILSDEQAKQLSARSAAIRRDRAHAVLAMLEQELWLQPEQRKPLLELIETSLPSRDDVQLQSQEYLRDINLLARALFKIPDAKINSVLSEHQQATWKQMKSHFQQQNNYLLIPMRMGGGGGMRIHLSD
jgi:hypothetical protein